MFSTLFRTIIISPLNSWYLSQALVVENIYCFIISFVPFFTFCIRVPVPFLLMDDVVFHELSRQSNGDRSRTHSLTHSLTQKRNDCSPIRIRPRLQLRINFLMPLSNLYYCMDAKYGDRSYYHIRPTLTKALLNKSISSSLNKHYIPHGTQRTLLAGQNLDATL